MKRNKWKVRELLTHFLCLSWLIPLLAALSLQRPTAERPCMARVCLHVLRECSLLTATRCLFWNVAAEAFCSHLSSSPFLRHSIQNKSKMLYFCAQRLLHIRGSMLNITCWKPGLPTQPGFAHAQDFPFSPPSFSMSSQSDLEKNKVIMFLCCLKPSIHRSPKPFSKLFAESLQNHPLCPPPPPFRIPSTDPAWFAHLTPQVSGFHFNVILERQESNYDSCFHKTGSYLIDARHCILSPNSIGSQPWILLGTLLPILCLSYSVSFQPQPCQDSLLHYWPI